MPRYESPIFVVGCQRSGTTLLQSMLSRSPEVVPVPETFFFEMVRPPLYPCRSWPIGGKEPMAQPTPERLAYWESNWKRFDIQHRPFDGAENVREVLERIVDAYNERGCQRFVEKSTYHLYYRDEILEFYPDAKIVAIVRDPYDAVISMRKLLDLQGKSGRTTRELARAWTEANRAILDQGLFHIRYEDLIRSPETVLGRVCEHCGLAFLPEMVTDFSRVAGTVVTGPESKWKTGVFQGLSDNSGKGRRNLSENERGIVTAVVGTVMERLGYEPDPARASASALVADALRFLPVWTKAQLRIAARTLALGRGRTS